MLLLVAFVSCEEEKQDGEKGTVCFSVGNQNECHHVTNVTEFKTKLEKMEKHKGDEHLRIARQGGALANLYAFSGPPTDGRKMWGLHKTPKNTRTN